MNIAVCRKSRAIQQYTNRFKSRKNLPTKQCRSVRNMRCFVEHPPRSYQIYTEQMTITNGILLGLQPERRAIIHGVIEAFAQYANNGRYL